MRDMRETTVWYSGEPASPAYEKPPVPRLALRGQSHMDLWKWYHGVPWDDTREPCSRLQNGVACALVRDGGQRANIYVARVDDFRK